MVTYFHSPDSAPTIQKIEDQFDFDDWDKEEASYDDVNDKELICPPMGTLDLGPCKFGAPLFVSWPNFYGADEVNLFIPADNFYINFKFK